MLGIGGAIKLIPLLLTPLLLLLPRRTARHAVVALLSSTLFFLRWCGMYWAIPSILATRSRAGFLGGCMNLGGNIAGVSVPIIVGLISFQTQYSIAWDEMMAASALFALPAAIFFLFVQRWR